jgi:hypothetical protein
MGAEYCVFFGEAQYLLPISTQSGRLLTFDFLVTFGFLAAAFVGRADVIVTRNLRDFPHAALVPYDIEARHPDTSIRQLLNLAPYAVVHAVRRQQATLLNPPVTMPELLASF